MKKSILLAGSLILALQLFAQKIEVTGKVTDGKSSEVLPGASIVIMGTTTGTSTNVNGIFSIQANPEDVLIVSFVGYIQKEIPVNNQNTINISLSPETIGMDEVIVIGYGTTTKEDATGAVSVVGSDDFNKGALTTADQLLTGKAAGVQITSSGGQPGSSSKILIRGGSSLYSTNDPLIVIDGVPIATSNIDGMSNPLTTIHPEDIESFTVLKDASATAIYGSRASNGVIIITTKQGKQGFHLSYSGQVSLATPSGKIDVLNSDEFRNVVKEQYSDNTQATDLLGDSNTDWQEEIMQKAFGTDHNLSMNGKAFDAMPYRASLGYSNQDGILKTSNLKRYTGSINLAPSLADNHIKIELNAKGMWIENQFAETGAVNNAVGFDPTQPVYSGNDEFGGFFTWQNASGNPITTAPRNPVAQLELRDNHSNVTRIIASAKIDYKLHFLPELTATFNLGTDRSDSDGRDFTPEIAPWDNQEGRKKLYTQNKTNNLLDFYLNYEKNIAPLNSKISATAGYSYQYFLRESFNETTDWTEQDTVTKGIPRPTDYVILSSFGRVNYVLAKKYILTLTLRQDMTSRFSEDNRAGLFPAVALAWNIKEEEFIKNIDVFSDLKLRLGYGVTGQQYVSDDDYPYFGTYESSNQTSQYQFGNQYYTTQRPKGYNPILKWEETTTYNVGLDFGLLKNRVNGSFEYYQRITDDLINKVSFPAGSNFVNEFEQNIGSLENKGVELTLNTKVISTPDFMWEVGINGSYNKNNITALTRVQDSTYAGEFEGDIGGGVGNKIQIHSVGYPAFSFYVYEQVYNENGSPIEGVYINRNGDNEFTEEDKYHYKKSTPDVLLGLNSTLRYKDLSFSFSGRLSLGNYMYNNIESQYTDYSGLYSSGYLSNRHTGIYDTKFENVQYWSDYFIQNASFFRMDHITASYFFKDTFAENLNVLAYLTVQNAFVITPYRGLDPERDNGIDNNVFPRPRTIILGFKVDF
jgi:iron complex outermembrane receptor protein